MVTWILVGLLLSSSLNTQIDETLNCMKNYMSSFQNSMVIQSPSVYRILQKAYPNTLATTVQHYNLSKGHEQTYIITGDIEAMWLRDSTNQFLPYLRMKEECPHMRQLTKGLLNTQAQFIMLDSYTNAFKRFEKDNLKRPFYLNDQSETLIFGIKVDLCHLKEYATKSIWERKFELDSLASFLRLSYEYVKRYNSTDFLNQNYFKALKRILSTLDQQGKDTGYEVEAKSEFYTFARKGTPNELSNGKIKGSFHTGMIKTGFRPSDDPNKLPFNIPGNAMMSSYLKLVNKQIMSRVPNDSIYKSLSKVLGLKMQRLSEQIKTGIYLYGTVEKNNERIFAYQVDGLGKYVLEDDANLPSLLSLPYMQFLKINDPFYTRTRKFLLSSGNPYFYDNGKISGIGSSHTQGRYVWPLALITQILTSDTSSQIKKCLEHLVISAKGNLIHESFSIDNPKSITRDWFAWANSFFGEMVLTLLENKPEILQQ